MNIQTIQGKIFDLQWKYQLLFGLGTFPKIINIIVESEKSLFVEYECGNKFRCIDGDWIII